MSVSETFIYQLIKGITSSIPNTKFLTATEPFYKDGIQYSIIPFLYKPSKFKNTLIPYLGQKGKKYTWLQQQKLSSRFLLPKINETDIVFIDYGTTAVSILPSLIKLSKPFIVHFHGFDITSSLSDNFYKDQLQIVFKKASYLVAASHHIKRLLILAGASEEKVKVIRLGVNNLIALKDPWKARLESNIKNIVFIGRLTPKKNPIALIHAFKLVQQTLPETTLQIVGDGSLLSDCKSLVIKLGLQEFIHFHGSLPNDQAMQLLVDAWLYAQHSVTAPSGDQEGFAISLAEAALYELPVVSTFHNGIPENVIDGETGYLVKEFDFEAMAERIIELLNHPEKCERMGKKGCEHITQLCDPQKRIDQVMHLFESIANE